MLGRFGGKNSAEVVVRDAAPVLSVAEVANGGFIQIDPNIVASEDDDLIVRTTIEAYKANAVHIIADMTVDDLVARASDPAHVTLLSHYETRGANGRSVFEPYVDAFMRTAGKRMVPSSFRPGQQWSVLTEQAHKALERVKQEQQTIDQPDTERERNLAMEQVRAAAEQQCLGELKNECLEPFVRSQIRAELVRKVERLARASDADMSDEHFNDRILPALAKYRDQDPSQTFALAKALHAKYIEECERQCTALDKGGKKAIAPDFRAAHPFSAAHRLAVAYISLGMSDTRAFKINFIPGVSENMGLQDAKVRYVRSYAASDLERINRTYDQKRLKLRGNESVREAARRTHGVHNYLLRSDMLNAKEVAYEINERTGLISVVRQTTREGAERAATATAQLGGQVIRRTTTTMRGIDLQELVEGKAIRRGVASALIAGGALSTMFGGGTAHAAETHSPVVAAANYTQEHTGLVAGGVTAAGSERIKTATANMAETFGRMSADSQKGSTDGSSADSVALDMAPAAFVTPVVAPEAMPSNNKNYKGLFGPKSQYAYNELMQHDKGNIVEERKAEAMKIYLEEGIDAKVAAAMIGNFMIESGYTLSPTVKQHGGGPGRGIAQWSVNERWANLCQWAESKGVSPYLFDTQVRFSVHELKTHYAHALSAAEAADTIYGATLAIEKYYEGPADIYASDNLRAHYAQGIFTRFMHYADNAPDPHAGQPAPPRTHEPAHRGQQPSHPAAPQPGSPGHTSPTSPPTIRTIGDILNYGNSPDTAPEKPNDGTISGVLDSLPPAETYPQQPSSSSGSNNEDGGAFTIPGSRQGNGAPDATRPPGDTVVGILDSISTDPAYTSPYKVVPAVAPIRPGTIGSLISDSPSQPPSVTDKTPEKQPHDKAPQVPRHEGQHKPDQQASPKGDKIAELALKLSWKDSSHGATSTPAYKRISHNDQTPDCGEFAAYVLREVDENVPRVWTHAQLQYLDNSHKWTPIANRGDDSNLQPGDVMVYSGYPKSPYGHIMIYVGGGQVAMASLGVIGNPSLAPYVQNVYFQDEGQPFRIFRFKG